jgi:ABC-2 type transport system permease protein
MGAEARPLRLAGPGRVGLRARLVGLGSVFGKTFRDGRRGMLLAALFGGGFMLTAAAPMAIQFATAASRAELAMQMELLPPVFRGLLGEPIRIDTLGGFLSWRVGNILPVILGIWSVLALSGTLAGEAARGSLDLLVTTPLSRRRIAVEKVLGHVVAVAIAMLLASLITWMAGMAFSTLPGDEIPLAAAVGHFTLTGLIMLAAGAVAFAGASVLGRTKGAALGVAALFGGYVLSSYAALSGAIAALSPLSWYTWTAGHRPLAGEWDVAPVAALAGLVVLLLAIGVVAFERRDLGSSAALRWLRLPALPAGTGGPFQRQLSDRSGIALAFGAGLGVYAAIIALSAEEFAAALGGIRGIEEMIAVLYPGIDFREPSGILQLAFFGFGSLLLGFGAAAVLAGWASEEMDHRLELVLSTPISRVRWGILSGLGVLAAIVLGAAVVGLAIGVASASLGADVITPLAGTAVLALTVSGLAGIGLAVGGLIRPGLASPVTAAVAVGWFLLDTLGEALQLPDAIVALSLYQHVGFPMAGQIEPGGVVAALLLAVGGLLLGAWGLARRDIGR